MNIGLGNLTELKGQLLAASLRSDSNYDAVITGIGLGVANPRTDTIEDPKQIVSRVKDVLKYFDPDKIFLNPDCGFGTFAERCVNTPDIAYRKLQAIAEAAEILRREYA